MQIARLSIADAALDAVRAMIVDGALPEGERINEVHLAAKLGVSRTPLREALNRLASEGALTSSPGHGYFVRPLTLEEFEQVYAIRPLLDPEALRLAGIPDAKKLARLQLLNERLRDADPGSAAATKLDDEWHLDLIGDCPNRVLVDLIQSMMQRTKRYEMALMRESAHVGRATGEHERILSALRDGNLRGACAALKANMQSGIEPIAVWLKTRTITPKQRRR
jgi:DNA-binding GntR family transcriptional regulator